ncbi:MAG TPA: hypothetical protein VFW25_15970 [Silvibacterium sp.]|nr:hypothetical protein [Silvibacterium sp.]
MGLKISYVRNAALLATSAATLIQLAIFFSVDNLIASALVLCGALTGFYYAVNRQLLDEYPISTYSIIGYTIYNFVVPPLGKLADFQGILQGLNHPILVWVYGVMGLFALVLAHCVYRGFLPYQTIRFSVTNIFYRPLHFFDMPNEIQFWIMGIVGIAATLATFRHPSAGGSSILSSVARGFVPLIYTPYLAAFPNLVDPRYRVKRGPIRLRLIAYSAVLIAASAAVNSRSFMLTGFASLICVYGYRVITGTISPPKLTAKFFIVIAVCLWLITGPMSNLAASMLIARKMRANVSPVELARTTGNIYRSGIAIKAYQNSLAHPVRAGSYNEAYYSSLFLNRFGNMRLTDLSIDAARGVMASGRSSYFRRNQLERVIAVLPDPIIRFLNWNIDKTEVLSGSSEDVLYELATGFPVGGFKTGSALVILRMTFGIMWPVYYGLMATFVFAVFDASTDVDSCWGGDNRRAGYVVFNPLIAATLFGYAFYLAIAQDVSYYAALLTRAWITIGVSYAVVFMLSKYISSLLLGWTWRR